MEDRARSYSKMAKQKYNPAKEEAKWQKFWQENATFKFDQKSDRTVYSIDTPPPTVSGKMHLGHSFSYSQQDFIARYQRMTGKNVFYPFGTDDNGLPTQLLIEKTKKVRAKKMGRVEFTKLCMETLANELRPKYIEDWKRIGMSCDWDIFYTTINEHSRTISQRSFIELFKKQRAYRKFAPAMVCPKCRTAISQVELEDLNRTSMLNHFNCEVEGGKTITIATTRPELMMACIAITVHPADDRYKNLVGKKAKLPATDLWVPILADDLTKMEFGTGAVYWCPFGDSADVEFVAKHPELNVCHIMNPDGRLNENAGKYAGMKSAEAREAVLEDWKAAGAIVKQEPTEQVVNVHERCGTPIEFVAMKQWFIKFLDLKKKWLERGEELNWYPEHMKNRYDNWVRGLKWDWNISRQIFFGVPFPVWYSKKNGAVILPDDDQLPVDPTTDKPSTLPEGHTYDDIEPETDIINTWATSSMSPQLAINLVEDEAMRKRLYPMDLRPQAHDIISFWLFNTVVKAQLHYDSLPWKNVAISGWALDPKGKKMSKSKGNVIEPQKIVEKYSADALRFWAASAKLGDDIPFQEKDVATGQKLINKLYNASKFAFMQVEGFDKDSKPTLGVLDRAVLSKLQTVVESATENFEKYDYSKPRSDTEQFFWHVFCDQYLELVKDRFYNDDRTGQRDSAQFVLFHALRTVLKLFAPIMPHITEELYHKYYIGEDNKESIHTSDWPSAVGTKDVDAEAVADTVFEIINAARKFKSEKQVSLNKPIKASIKANLTKAQFDEIKADLIGTIRATEVSFKTAQEMSAIFELIEESV